MAEATLSKLTYSFKTTTNDKDWDTEVGVEVIHDGHDIAKRFDFNHDEHEDHWADGAQKGPWDLPITDHIGKFDVERSTYRVSAKAVKN